MTSVTSLSHLPTTGTHFSAAKNTTAQTAPLNSQDSIRFSGKRIEFYQSDGQTKIIGGTGEGSARNRELYQGNTIYEGDVLVRHGVDLTKTKGFLMVNGNLTIENNATVGDVFATGNITLKGHTFGPGGLVKGNLVAGGNLVMEGASILGAAAVNGNAWLNDGYLTGALTVSGDSTYIAIGSRVQDVSAKGGATICGKAQNVVAEGRLSIDSCAEIQNGTSKTSTSMMGSGKVHGTLTTPSLFVHGPAQVHQLVITSPRPEGEANPLKNPFFISDDRALIENARFSA